MDVSGYQDGRVLKMMLPKSQNVFFSMPKRSELDGVVLVHSRKFKSQYGCVWKWVNKDSDELPLDFFSGYW